MIGQKNLVFSIIFGFLISGLLFANQEAFAGALAFEKGDVFVGVGDGKISIFKPDGTFVRTLDTTSNSAEQTGMCFDKDGNLRVTSFTTNTMTLFDNFGNLVTHPWGAVDSNSFAESCVVDANGDVYVGQAGGIGGNRDIKKFDAAGNFLQRFSPDTTNKGTDWIDLAADQCTMFYTSESPEIKRYDVCNDTQLTDFASGLGNSCFANRIRDNGEVLVACVNNVHRLSPTGSILQTYPASSLIPFPTFLFGLNLDPDGTSFWTLNISNGRTYRIDIETGNLLTFFTAPPLGRSTAGLAVFGELTVSLPPGNTPPVAVVQDVTVSADSNCEASASIDNGSFDPDGDDITLSQEPSGLYPLGDTLVTLTVSDGTDSDSDMATVTVTDVTPPDVSASLVPIDVEEDEGLFRVEFSADDNCDANPAVNALLNGEPVTNGQLVELEIDDDVEVEFDDGILEMEAPSFELIVTATDASGNTGVGRAIPMFVDEDDKCREEENESNESNKSHDFDGSDGSDDSGGSDSTDRSACPNDSDSSDGSESSDGSDSSRN